MSLILQTTVAMLWPWLALAAAAMATGVVLRHPRVKGWWGEQQVRAMLRTGLNPHLYVDLHNVTLPLPEGGSTQIDHLLFSPYGVFVLETKRMKGWIYGSAHQAEWTQKIHPRHSQKFQNPLRQNYLHTKTVQALLQLSAAHVHSVVVFMGDSQFKTDLPPHVTQGKGCVDYILRFQQQAWGPEVMQALIDRMEQLRLNPSRATQKSHAAHVMQVQARNAVKARGQAPRAQPSTETPGAPAAVPSPAAPSAASTASVTDGTGPGARTALPVPGAPSRPAQAAARATGDAPAAASVLVTAPTSASTVPTAPAAESVGMPAPPRAAQVCPQCQSALRRLRLQRGPLAGQVVYRCSNTALCHYVQPQPDSTPV